MVQKDISNDILRNSLTENNVLKISKSILWQKMKIIVFKSQPRPSNPLEITTTLKPRADCVLFGDLILYFLWDFSIQKIVSEFRIIASNKEQST